MKSVCPIKTAAILVVASCLCLFSCQNDLPTNSDVALIDSIENSLLPSILIEGEPVEGFNLLDRMDYYKVPGISIAFMNGGEIVWARGYGYASADSARLVDEKTLFQAASISKPLAAMAALSLVEEGKIDLDEDVNQYLVGWQVEENEQTVSEKVSLRRLLSHSAGLTVHGFAGYAYNEELPSVIEILNGEAPANSGRIYPENTPGTHYSYSGGGYTVMQKMLTDITGKQFPDIMDEYVLSKIGMESSTYQQPLPEEFHENAAAGHLQGGEMIEGRWHTYPEMAAAGLWTTPTDLLKYAREVQLSNAGESNKILSQPMVAEMLTPQMNDHGLGPGIQGSGETSTFGHGGSNAGFRCQFFAFTKLGQGVAIMTNGDNGGYILGEILRSFSQVYDWSMYKPDTRELWPLDQEDLEALSGQYQLSIDGQDLVIEFSIQQDHLKGIQLWDELSFEIYPESKNRFFNMEDGVNFVFDLNPEGTLQLTIYQYGEEFRFLKI
jgi:CubicO group peptidase (beta-lactamase class C family)